MKKNLKVRIVSAVFLFYFLWAALPAAAFETAEPEQAGVDSGVLHDTLNLIPMGDLDIHSILILKNGRLILESYVHPYTAGTLHNIKSVSKSILSALVGIALEEGYIKGPDEKLADAFPEYADLLADRRKHAITLEHLLTMQAGFEFKENSKISERWKRSDNWVKYAIGMPMAHPPGTRFTYSTANTHLVSAWLTKAAGMDTHVFARKKLFTPLGIRDVTWLKAPEGIDMGGSQVYLTPRAMLKFGALYLHRGHFGGRQVVPGDWVAASTAVHAATGSGGGYGYWWWQTDDAKGYMAAGWGGQRIAVFPDKDMVIVITAGNAGHAAFLLEQLSGGIVPADHTLPDNPEKQAALAQRIKELAVPAPETPLPLPRLASGISGITFAMGKNRLGFSGMKFDFSHPDSASVAVTFNDEDFFPVNLGTDARFRLTESPGMGHRRKENTQMAARCRWENDTLFIELLPVGEPFRYKAAFEFRNDRINGIMRIHPIDKLMPLRGKMLDNGVEQ